MKRFIDVTSPDVWVKTPACTMMREIFAELTHHWMRGRTEFGFLTRPFAALRCGCPSGMARRGPAH